MQLQLVGEKKKKEPEKRGCQHSLVSIHEGKFGCKTMYWFFLLIFHSFFHNDTTKGQNRTFPYICKRAEQRRKLEVEAENRKGLSCLKRICHHWRVFNYERRLSPERLGHPSLSHHCTVSRKANHYAFWEHLIRRQKELRSIWGLM